MNPTIFLVEDDPASARLLQMMLKNDAEIEVFEQAEDCLMHLAESKPSIFLLDVGLPGIDGYALCEQLKQRPDTADIPVIFISGHVEMEARIRAYEIGAHDFIVKPFDVTEVRSKLGRLLESLRERAGLNTRLEESDLLTTLILSNLDEYAVVLKYLRDLNSCTSPQEMAQMTHTMLRGFGLSGAVQLRLPESTLNTSADGEATPIVTSILNHVRLMNRIFEFKKRGVYNFERITMIVDNMPVDDPERCGRLRDHLAIAIETADARLAGLLATSANSRADLNLNETLQLLARATEEFSLRQRTAQEAGREVMRELTEEMHGTFAHLGMNQLQEDSILDLIEQKTQKLILIYDATAATQATLQKLQVQMNTMRSTLKG